MVVESLLLFVKRNPIALQCEMTRFLHEEFDLVVHQATVSKILKKDRQSRKLAERISPRQSARLRQLCKADLMGLTAEQLVFADDEF